MKFSKLKYALKNDRTFLKVFIFACVLVFLDLALVIFDLVKVLTISEISAKLSFGFLAFNIILVVLNFAFLILNIVILIKKNK